MSAPDRRVIYTRTAARQLSDILVESERQWGRAQRVAYGERLRRAVRAIADNPELGRRRDELAEAVRAHRVGSHILYYWVRDETIVVATVLHERMDPARYEWSDAEDEAEE